jgi:hypothetical protein
MSWEPGAAMRWAALNGQCQSDLVTPSGSVMRWGLVTRWGPVTRSGPVTH